MKSGSLLAIYLLFSALFAELHGVETGENENFKPNTWVDAKLNYVIPEKYKTKRWSTGDGYCGSLYRSKTGTVLIRTGIHSKEYGLNPGYYSNTQLEWDLKTNKVEVVDVFKWGGGSSGGGKLLPGFKENPTPSPRHTYDGLVYVPEEDAMYLMLGATWKICLDKTKTNPEAIAQNILDEKSTWKFSFADKKWTRIDGNIRQFWNGNRVSPYEGHMEYWPEGKKIMYMDATCRYYAEFDIKTQKWEKLNLANKGETFKGRTAWDSKRSLWLFRSGERVTAFDPEKRIFTKFKNCWDLPMYPNKEKQKEMKENNIKIDPRYSWKGVVYNSKHDVYIVCGPTGNDTRVYNPNKEVWSDIKGGDIKLVNGYLEYDPITDLTALVYQHSAFTLKYVP
jgi:hypothetical protein